MIIHDGSPLRHAALLLTIAWRSERQMKRQRETQVSIERSIDLNKKIIIQRLVHEQQYSPPLNVSGHLSWREVYF